MEKDIKRFDEIEMMKCERCGKQRIKTKSGICLICEPNHIHGEEVNESDYLSRAGTEIKSKSGTIDENRWMRG